jgi:hypothetical protein
MGLNVNSDRVPTGMSNLNTGITIKAVIIYTPDRVATWYFIDYIPTLVAGIAQSAL